MTNLVPVDPTHEIVDSPFAEAKDESRPHTQSWLDKPLLAWLDWEKAIYLVLILAAVLTRFWDLGARVMSHDESLHTYFSYNLATGKGFNHTPMMHGPFLFHATALSYFLFGADDFTSRIPTAVFGIILVALPYFFRKQLGRAGALATSFVLLISPSILYHARYIRQEEFVLVWTALTILCLWRYLETRRSGWLIGLTVVLAFHATDKSTSFLTVAWLLIFLAPLALAQLYLARRRASDVLTGLGLAAALGVFMLIASVGMELLARFLSNQLQLGGTVVSAESLVVSLDRQLLLFGAFAILAGLGLAATLTFLLKTFFGHWLALASRAAPAFNLVIVLVTTTMFMASPAMLIALNPIWRATSGANLIDVSLLGQMGNLSTNSAVIVTMFALTVSVWAVSAGIGLAWNWRRWLPIAAVFLGITVTLFTTVYTNVAGIGTGLVGQLGYWMAQQDVQRGSQPWYYYLLITPLYDYLALVGALCAFACLLYCAVRWLFAVASRAPAAPAGAPDTPPPAPGRLPAPSQPARGRPDLASVLSSITLQQLWPLLLAWWAVSAWLIYTLAGEKMPWLTVHIVLPMAFLTGWFVDRVVSSGASTSLFAVKTTAQTDLSGNTRALAIAGLATLAVVLVVRELSLIGGLNIPPGDTSKLLGWGLSFGLSGLGLGLVGYLLWRLSPRWGGRAVLLAGFALLAGLTVRTAYTVTYINYDYAKEFLFYAHGAPGTKLAVEQLDDLSKRIKGGDSLKVGYDSESSWPMSWYMRLFPNARFIGNDLPGDFIDLEALLISDQNVNRASITPRLEENYTAFHYALVWWPMQDYYDLTWERISYSLFNPEARAALWDIVFNRDFTRYSQVFGKTTLTPDTWSPSHRFTLYVRNDVVSQVWDYRAGAVATGSSLAPVNPTAASLRIQNPVGIAIAEGGERFIIDHTANRVFRQDASGAIQTHWGGLGGAEGKFNDAWGIAMDSDGSVFVADTFNHRIQKFDRDGNFLFAWGQPGVSNAPGNGRSTIFFGPRAIAIDRQGKLYVTDTGNKRVQVFDRDGNYVAQFGHEGSGDGEFSEPVGLAVDSGGFIYVADTWNKRIQVFDSNYQPVRSWPVEAWQGMPPSDLQSVDHKPFLALGGGTLYVSSPKTNQVLAYTTLGQPAELTAVALPENALPTGLAVYQGVLYVTGAGTGQVYAFPLSSNMQ